MPKSALPAKPVPRATAKRSSKRKSTTKTLATTIAAEQAKRQKDSKKGAKPKRNRMVRDSFNMPESEYSLIAAVKKRCIAQGLAVKKSEVLRAAIFGFASQSDEYIKAAMQALEVIKTGRPPKEQR